MLVGQFTIQSLCILLAVGNLYACFPGSSRIKLRRPRKEPPLIFKEHEPNTHETSALASGPAEGRISRSDKRFKNLVYNNNRDILFKDEEMTGEDRIMSRRCKERLDTLALLVVNYWPGVKLRVTEAWDEHGYHLPSSLHTEGRAVDITTSDKDKSKYGMLARLARQAGFDWVHYESKAHVHASVKSDSALGLKLRGCFPGISTVITEQGRKSMSSLHVGDRVLSMLADGTTAFQPVLMFLHRNVDMNELYVKLSTSVGTEITLTPFHLIYVARTNVSINGRRDFRLTYEPMFAEDVRVGHYILSTINVSQDQNVSFCTSSTVPSLVTQTRTVTRKGVYAPLTAADTIVVDNVVASCYASYENEWVSRYLFLPAKYYLQTKESLVSYGKYFFSQLIPWQFDSIDSTTPESNSTEIHSYARFLLWFYRLFWKCLN